MYSWGNDIENTGLLGLNANYNQSTPIINHNFSDKKIDIISLSDQHALAIDFNHQCYTWGIMTTNEISHCSQLNSHLTTTIQNIPSLLNEGKLYIQKGKCGNRFIALMDFGGYLYYIGCLNSKSICSKNTLLSLSSPKFIQFDYLVTSIKDFACGESIIGIIDTQGQLYLFNEDEGLLKIKLAKKIGEIAIRKKCIYALSKDTDYIYVFSKQSSLSNIVDYIQNEFEIKKAIGEVNIIDTGYYNTNTIFFSYESDYSRAIVSETHLNSIFKQIKIRQNNGIEISSQWLRDDQSLSDSVYPVNSSSNFNKSILSMSKISKVTKLNPRIEKISNLLGVIFDKQIDKFNEKRSRSTKKRIEVENVVVNYNTRHEYGFGFTKKEDRRDITLSSSKLKSILDTKIKDKGNELKGDDSNDQLYTRTQNNNMSLSFSSEKMSDYKNNNNNQNNMIHWYNYLSDTNSEKNNILNNPYEKEEVSINLNGENTALKKSLKAIKEDQPSKSLPCVNLQSNIQSIKSAYMIYFNREKRSIAKTMFEFTFSPHKNKNKEFQSPLSIFANQSSFSFKSKSNSNQANGMIENNINTSRSQNQSRNHNDQCNNNQVIINHNDEHQHKKPMYSKVIVSHNKEKELLAKRNPSTDAIYKKRIITETSFQLRKKNQMSNKINTNQINTNHYYSQKHIDDYSLKDNDYILNQENSLKDKNSQSQENDNQSNKDINTHALVDNSKMLNYQSKKIYPTNNSIDKLLNTKQQIEEEQLNDTQMQTSAKISKKRNEYKQETKNNPLSKSFVPQIINNIDLNNDNKTNTISPSKLQKYFSHNYSTHTNSNTKTKTKTHNPIKLIAEKKNINLDTLNKPLLEQKIRNPITNTNTNYNNYLHPITENNFTRSRSNNKIQTIYNMNTETNVDEGKNQLIRNQSQVIINKNRSKHHHNLIHNHKQGRSLTPLRLISKPFHNYHQHPIKLNQAMGQSGIDTKEKIFKAVELLKQKYISYLEKVYGNNKETILSSPSIENEDFLIKDFLTSEINGDSEYLKPCESFLSQDELDSFFYHNLKFKHIKEQININHDIIGDITRYVSLQL